MALNCVLMWLIYLPFLAAKLGTWDHPHVGYVTELRTRRQVPQNMPPAE